MVVAMALLLAASLLVLPATAARGDEIRDIRDGATIFVWEEDLNLTPINKTGTGNVTSLNKYVDDDTSKALVHEIPVDEPDGFDVLESLVDGHYGVYYVETRVGGTGPAAYSETIRIRKPVMTADAVLTESVTSSIDGATIARTSNITFRIDAPLVGPLYKNNGDTQNATAKIEFTTPADGITTRFGGKLFEGIHVNKSQVFTDFVVPSAESAGTYTAVVKWDDVPTSFDNYAPNSNTMTFTLTTKVVSITSNRDSVIRNNNFAVTITGESLKDYYVYIENPADQTAKNPMFRPDQPKVNSSQAALNQMDNYTDPKLTNFKNVSGTGAILETSAAGTRTAEFNTTGSTDAKTYTIRVVDAEDPGKYDTVKVRVEEGDITITADGDRTFYLGEEITFSGTNTDTNKVWLFVTGPNLNRDGAYPYEVTESVDKSDPGTFKEVDVEADDTWEWKFDTQRFNVDAGTYTFYALTEKETRAGLSNVKYDTVSVVVRQGFLSSSVSQSTVAKGDSLFIRGTAQGNPSEVAVWIIGPNMIKSERETVEDDASFEYELKSDSTKDLAAGQYFVVVQHPMGNNKLDVVRTQAAAPTVEDWVDGEHVRIRGTEELTGTNVFKVLGTDRLQGPHAAQALIDLLNNQNVDDTYNRLTFLVQEPWIRVDAISDKYVGSTFTITGTTNLGVDHELLVDIKSSAFEPADKAVTGEFYGDAGTIKVVEGDAGYNTWSFEVDATAFKPDEYIVIVESIEADTTTTANFNVLEGVPATPTPEPVDPTPTPEPTPVEPTPVPTPEAPGFGALVAIAGLGAVAFLVLRRD